MRGRARLPCQFGGQAKHVTVILSRPPAGRQVSERCFLTAQWESADEPLGLLSNKNLYN